MGSERLQTLSKLARLFYQFQHAQEMPKLRFRYRYNWCLYHPLQALLCFILDRGHLSFSRFNWCLYHPYSLFRRTITSHRRQFYESFDNAVTILKWRRICEVIGPIAICVFRNTVQHIKLDSENIGISKILEARSSPDGTAIKYWYWKQPF